MVFILLISFLVIYLILMIPLEIRVNYCRENRDDEFELELYVLFDFYLFRIHIPFLKNALFSFFTRFVIEIDAIFLNLFSGKGEVEIEEELYWRKFNLDKIFQLFNKDRISLIISSLKIRSKDISWKTKFGTGDPAFTGITYGLAWSLKGIALNLINEISVNVPDIETKIVPDFYDSIFLMSFRGIFSLRLGNIILTGLRLIKEDNIKW